MLVKFALEPDAIDNSTTQACNNRLIEVWERFGILVYPDPQAIPDRIRELPPQPQGRWQRTWTRVLRYPHHFRRSLSLDENFTFSSITEPHQLAQQHEFELAILEETRALELDIAEGEGKLFRDVEGIRLCDIDQSEKAGRSERLNNEIVRINKSVEDLWQERFQRFAEYSENIVIFDAYAVRDDGNHNIQGLCRLLEFLERDSKGCNIVIYSSPDPNNVNAEVTSIRNRLEVEAGGFNNDRIKSIEVRLFHFDRFRRPGHDRHIRFNDNIFNVGIGTELFHYPNVQQAMNCTQTVLEPSKPEYRERRLDNDQRAKIDAFPIPIGTSTP